MKPNHALLIAAASTLGLGATAPSGELELRIDHLRNAKGMVQICLTARGETFPDCAKDKQAITRTIPANAAASLRFGNLRPGTYALAIFHDENGNRKLDTFLGIPREGFGFSRNPTIRFGPPRFDQAGFEVADGIARVTVRMQYLL